MIPRLHPRHHIDIGPAHLTHGLAACLLPPREAAIRDTVEALADPARETLATLSVRSAFDLLLTSLALPPGDEVLLSALTIPDMARLVRAHGLVPVPVDVDPASLEVLPEALSAAWSPRSRVLVIAQLLGNRSDPTLARRFAEDRGLLFVDDSAQAYLGPPSLRGGDADVVFHSFGSIKTATCLGGALVRVRDPALRAAMRGHQARWPLQDDAAYARKLALYLSLRAPRHPRAYTVFAHACERSGHGLDAVVTSMTKGFPADDLDGFLRAIRRRPCPALLAVVRRRLATYRGDRAQRRAQAGERVAALLGGTIDLLGRAQTERTHWLLAVLVDEPRALLAPLRRAGFDAARGATTITALPAPPERPLATSPRASEVMERVLFLPTYPEIPSDDLARLTSTLMDLTARPPRR